MTAHLDFEYKNQKFHYDLKYSEADRNYDDEDYIEFFKDAFRRGDEYIGGFEFTLWQEWRSDGCQYMTDRCTVDVYDDWYDDEPSAQLHINVTYTNE